MNNRFTQTLEEKQVLLADGATGTNHFDRGLEAGAPPELWNIGTPREVSKVEGLHMEFIEAGADLILTNSFGANEARLELHKAADKAIEINYRAATHARIATKISGKPDVLVAGSVGPTGNIFEPIGNFSVDAAAEMFEKQGSGLASGGVDCFWVETMSSWEEMDAAIRGLARFNLPIIATVSFDTVGHTMMGISPKEYYRGIRERVDVLGANCGKGPEIALQALKEMMDAELLNLVMKPGTIDAKGFQKNKSNFAIKANCGVPIFEGAEAVYQGTPELMAAYTGMAAQMGAKIIGGCCGTTSVHVRAMCDALDLYLAVQKKEEPKEKPTKVRRRK